MQLMLQNKLFVLLSLLKWAFYLGFTIGCQIINSFITMANLICQAVPSKQPSVIVLWEVLRHLWAHPRISQFLHQCLKAEYIIGNWHFGTGNFDTLTSGCVRINYNHAGYLNDFYWFSL